MKNVIDSRSMDDVILPRKKSKTIQRFEALISYDQPVRVAIAMLMRGGPSQQEIAKELEICLDVACEALENE